MHAWCSFCCDASVLIVFMGKNMYKLVAIKFEGGFVNQNINGYALLFLLLFGGDFCGKMGCIVAIYSVYIAKATCVNLYMNLGSTVA